jgi:hypothetical protein
MATLLNGNDTNRLVEVLAGSTALLNDTSGGSALPLSLNALLGDDTASADVTATAATADGPLVTAGLLDPVTDIVDGALGTDTSNLLGIGDVLNLGTPSQLALAGPEGGAQPVFDATNVLVKDVHYELEILSYKIGAPDLIHSITNLGETTGLGNLGVVADAADDHTNLLTDMVNTPSTLLNGGIDDVLAQVSGDLGDTLHAVTGVVSNLVRGGDALNPLPEIIDGLGANLQNLPILSINGGDNVDSGGLLGGLGGGLLNGTVGDLAGSSSGHLIDIDAGPANSNGLGLDLLATPDGTHSASVNAIDVGPNGPHLLDLGLLTGDGLLDLGGSGEAGASGLGNLLDGTESLGGLLGGAGSKGGPLAGAGIIDIPGLGGAGADGLTGSLLGSDGLVGGLLSGHALGSGLLNGDIASGNTTSAPITAPLDIAVLTDTIAAPLTGDHGILDLHGAHIL